MDLNEFSKKYGENILKVMEKRTSVRDYYGYTKCVDLQKEELLIKYISTLTEGPFGTKTFVLNVPKPMGTFKVISYDGETTDSPHFLVGGIMSNFENKNNIGIIDFGYCFEKAILAATALGFGTCWIAGTFHSKEAERFITLSQQHKTFCITPYGPPKPRDKVSFGRRVFLRLLVGNARARVAVTKIFFLNDFNTPISYAKLPDDLLLIQEKIGNPQAIQTIIESVRWGPSARNMQEWRIIYRAADKTFYFFTKSVTKVMKHIDIGIAMCHFEQAAIECKLPGKWLLDPYIVKESEFKPPMLTKFHFAWRII